MPLPTIEAINAATEGARTAFDLLSSARERLVNDRDGASARLDDVIGSLEKSFSTIDDALAAMCNLSFDSPADVQMSLRALGDFEAGKGLLVELEKARYHCTKIEMSTKNTSSAGGPKSSAGRSS